MEEGTVGEAEVFTEAAVGADFTEAEVLAVEEATLLSVDTRSAAVDFEAVSTAAEALVAGDFMVAAVLAGAVEAGVGADEAGVGAGDLAGAGRIGVMAGDIRMATTATIRAITRPTLIIRTRPTDIQRIT
jgi:hypothetical protein